MTTPAVLELEHISLGYPVAGGLQMVVQDLSLCLERGQIGCLLGASGCGKTTVLRAVAGFEPTRAGRIVLAGEVIAEGELQWPPEQRRVGMVFQDYALFPHLDVAANVGFGLRRMPRAARDAQVRAMLERVGLWAYAARYPHELSGGQQQRVALARALAPEPEVLLLDEPFSNLDIHTRARLAVELRDLLKASGTTALLVTHDQAEAFAMADMIGVMHGGHLLQWASARELYRQPAHRFVAGFIGRGALVPAAALGLEGDDDVLLRPEHLLPDADGPIRASLLEAAFLGPGGVGELALPGGERIQADLSPDMAWQPGQVMGFRLAPGARLRFPREPRR